MSENPVLKAISESDTQRAIVRAETRKRKNWGYIQLTELQTWAETQIWPNTEDGSAIIPAIDDVARRFFGTKLDAVVKHGGTPELVAVWRKLEEPDTEPLFRGPEDLEE